MDTLTTVIKFIGAGNGSAPEAPASTAFTGDISTLLVLLFSAAVFVICAFAIVALRKHAFGRLHSSAIIKSGKTASKIFWGLCILCGRNIANI